MNKTIATYNRALSTVDRTICERLAQTIDKELPKAESRIWHAHPVWFLDGNPIVGYSKLKAGVRLMFWSGASFHAKGLKPGTGKFKDASATYTSESEIKTTDLKRWLKEAKTIQWDYKNIVKRKGRLVKIVIT